MSGVKIESVDVIFTGQSDPGESPANCGKDRNRIVTDRNFCNEVLAFFEALHDCSQTNPPEWWTELQKKLARERQLRMADRGGE